jgi:thiol-disulfide isomerase/thioredoxin
MRVRKGAVFPLGVLTLILVVTLFNLPSEKRLPITSQAGEATETAVSMLHFVFQDSVGNEVPFSAYQGKWVLINFWASWCTPCKEELPMLDSFYQQHRENNFVLLAVNVSDRPPDALAYALENGYTFPLVYDPPGNVMVELGIRGLPASLLIGPEGGLRQSWIGAVDQENLEDLVVPYLSGE